MGRRLNPILMLGLLCASALLFGCSANGGGPGIFASRSDDDPRGTRYTVQLAVYRSPSHVQEASYVKRAMEEKLGWKDLTIIHHDDYSELNWGQFDSKEKAQPALKKAKEYRAQNGAEVFRLATITDLPVKVEAPPEWNLANHKDAAYTYLVAVFQNDPTAEPPYHSAVEDCLKYCRVLRDEGQEAFYYVSGSKMHVTISLFGPEAVRITRVPRTVEGEVRPMLVEQAELVDPRALALQKQYPDLAYNGHKLIDVVRDPSGRVVAKQAQKTYMVQVPDSVN